MATGPTMPTLTLPASNDFAPMLTDWLAKWMRDRLRKQAKNGARPTPDDWKEVDDLLALATRMRQWRLDNLKPLLPPPSAATTLGCKVE